MLRNKISFIRAPSVKKEPDELQHLGALKVFRQPYEFLHDNAVIRGCNRPKV